MTIVQTESLPNSTRKGSYVMSTPQTMAEIMKRIDQAMQRFDQALAALSPAEMLEPRLSDSRSVKDMLAHLRWWDQWLLFTLPADPNTPDSPITLPLADQIPSPDHWADE